MSTIGTSKSKRDELLGIASRLFYEQGYHRTGVKQIIDTAGIAKGTFYAHFKSKEALGVAWLTARHSEWNRMLETFLTENHGTVAESKILGMFDFLEAWLPASDFRGCAFLNTLGETPDPSSPLRLEIRNHKESLIALIEGWVSEHSSEKAETRVLQLTRSIYLLFEGAIIEMQNFRDVWPAQAAKEQVRQLLA